MKLWSGMLDGNLNKDAESFNSSIRIDQRLVFDDIKGSIAHVKMLGRQGIIKKEESEKIIAGLNLIEEKLKAKTLKIDQGSEDIHTFVEGALIEEIGEVGKKMHTARSRNDQVTTDLKLFLKRESLEIINLLKVYTKSLTDLAGDNTETIMPGYTHLQAAQPVSLAHHLMAYAFMNLRDIGRMEDYIKRLKQLPLGACALAGTSYDIDRDFVAAELGLDSVMANSMDAVSDRDYIMELSSVLSIIAVHLSRFAEEIINWASPTYKFIDLDDKFATGSSIMPQKKNPDMAELIRGKAARLIGNMNQAFVMMKSLPLSYAKDMQEDKEYIFDSIDTIKMSLKIMAGQIKTLTINKENMLKACKDGFLNATDVADYLVKKGQNFRDAHHIAARLVKYAIEKNLTLEELDIGVYQKESDLFEDDIYQAIDLKTCLKMRKSKGGSAPEEVLKQIGFVEEKISKH